MRLENMGINSFENNFWTNKKVFVTGHTGFKGSWLCMLLHELGAKVYGYALNPPTEPSLYKLCEIDKIVHSTIADIRDYKSLSEAINNAQPEIVIHMAAQPLVRLSYKNPVETYEVNMMGTVNLLEAIRTANSVKAVVNVTTDKCYENKEWLWGYRENEPMGGHDPYSSSKACSEIITAAYRKSFFTPENNKPTTCIATARAGNVIGGGDWAEDRLIPDFVRAIIKNEKITIRYPNAIRPWQHVLEPLTGYLMLAEALCEKGISFAESWNFGPNDTDVKTVEWIVKYLCNKFENFIGYQVDENKNLHEANYLKLDCSKAKTLLKWEPKWSLTNTLDSIIEFTTAYQKNENLKAICIGQIQEYLKK